MPIGNARVRWHHSGTSIYHHSILVRTYFAVYLSKDTRDVFLLSLSLSLSPMHLYFLRKSPLSEHGEID